MEAGGSHGHMSPEEHYRRMMSALSEQGSFEDQQQRLYQLASSMGLPGHGESTGSVFECVCSGVAIIIPADHSCSDSSCCSICTSLHS